jgi:cytochrome c-type biogenesis protein
MGEAAHVSVLVAFGGGLFSFLSPCVLPLFPSYLSFITGMSVEELQAASESTRRRVLGHSVAFVLGFSAVFVAMGASLSAASQLLIDYRDVVRWGGGLLIIGLGLYLTGLLRLGWLGRTQQFALRAKPAGLVGSWLVGVTFAAGWTPCVGPILGSILTLAGTSGAVSTGVTLLAAYSAGLALPFLLASLALGAFLAGVRRFRPWIPVVERTAGILLVVVGVLVLTDSLAVLNAYAVRITPVWLLERL